MAVDTKKKQKAADKKPVKSLFDEKPKQDDFTELLQDVRERPVLYAGIAAFLIACLLAGFLYRANAVSSRKEVLTAYAQALDKEEPADQLAALEPLSQSAAKGNDEVVYVTGETAYSAGQFDKAKAAFERMRNDFKDSPYAPEAVEGLGNIAENAKDYDAALGYYKEVGEKWGSSFAARRQPMNIAKMEERRGQFAEAVAAYREQLQVFPGSTLAAEASAALARLEKAKPELFPKVEMPAAPAAAGAEPPAAGEPVAPNLNMQLQAPDVSETSTQPADSDLELKLNLPEIPGATSEPADAPSGAESPAPAESAQ